ncbi:uncharacterized protein LOC124364836 [Homalodisca vitripennis]|uniref:Uncharacterized protein n=2 Tax=Proconiini TaxID=565685 RepID=A0A1B6F4J5_9HEMI|nr:uncharacterized protein LOC124364596 [Homalodisca vitripennis]XP_046676571.1 uncharacterized protein LOC124364836 [Homalodisca vitripennis]
MAVAKDKKLKWEPTHKAKPPDGIKSSDYAHAKPFIPSYEHEGRPKMGLLMSNEYARMWHREKEEFERPVVVDSKYLPKKCVIRGLNKKKQNLKAANKENVKKKSK